MADPFGDFGNLQIPDLLCSTYLNPDLDFLDSQNSLYQARMEDITLLEENMNLASGANLTFGEELVPSAMDLILDESAFSATYRHQAEQVVEQVPGPTTASVDEPTEPKAKWPKTKAVCYSIVHPQTELCTLTGVQEQMAERVPELVEQSEVQHSIMQFELPLEPASHVDAPQSVVGQLVQQDSEHLDQPTVISTDVAPQPELANESGSVQAPILPTWTTPVVYHELQKSIRNQLNSIPLVQLDRLPLIPSRPRRLPKSRLLVDEKTRLTVAELRWNMEHGELTSMPASARLAEPSSRTRTQFLLSRSVPRLLAVPATLGTALSASLCELWCRHRRFGAEQVDALGHDSEMQLLAAASNRSGHQYPPTTDRPDRLTEETEASLEQRRGDQQTMSLGPSGSLLGSSNPLELTVNQIPGAMDSVLSSKSLIPDNVNAATTTPRPTVSVPEHVQPIVQPTLNLTETLSIPQELTTLVPLPEEQEEQVQQSESMVPPLPVEEHMNAHPNVTCQYSTIDQVWSRLQKLLANSKGPVDITRMLGPAECTSKQDAAMVFSSLLRKYLIKRKLVRSTQLAPYGPILVSYY
ncbi:uncharacterized protein DEA37_0002119 [Paragonimus westermani]|uniref:Rad21/Rec8-like protein C-terminal eukaryotic domain-containing protein n=1 Tax=Paragonimus westermani TaxID=34504 RepID=A0A5J4NBJ2_9TREM|nr:uncharacterized protein DEA37_0002119 [Paragonimus westermani]